MNQENKNNHVEIQGYLCKDIVVEETKNGKKKASLMLNVWNGKDADGNNKYMTMFVTAYGDKAEEFANAYEKKQLVGVCGYHSSRLDEDGYSKSIVANSMYAVDLTKEDKGNSNLSVLQGFLCKDIELSETKNGKAIANIMLNVKQGKTKDESGAEKDKYSPVFIKAYGDKAKEFAENFEKGALVEIKGRMSTSFDKDKDSKRYNEDIIANEIVALERAVKKATEKAAEAVKAEKAAPVEKAAEAVKAEKAAPVEKAAEPVKAEKAAPRKESMEKAVPIKKATPKKAAPKKDVEVER